MKNILAFILISLSFLSSAQEKSTPLSKEVLELASKLEEQHPFEFMKEAANFYAKDKLNDAGFLFYLGQLRYKYYISANPDVKDADKALFASLQSNIGMEINFALGANLDNYLSIIDHVISWDEKHDYKFYSKTKSPDNHKEILDGLIKLRKYIVENKTELNQARKDNKE